MPTTRARAIGAQLKHLRKKAGHSQEVLASLVGYSPGYISMLERGERIPSPTTLAQLADALGLSEERYAEFMHLVSQISSISESSAFSTSFVSAYLPVPLHSVIGREPEEATAVHLLKQDRVRLLTLTGPAGVGKTRLAIQVATGFSATSAESAFINLTPIPDHQHVIATIAQAFGVAERPATSFLHTLITALRNRSMLLVIDNFEHVLPAAPSLLEILVACPQIKMLVTSREALRVRGEQELAVQPLTFPDPRQALTSDTYEQYSAIELFLQRVREHTPTFHLSTSKEGQLIAQICARLDGLPLAIELAAAQLRYTPLSEVYTQLTSQAPLALLAGGARDLPDHQQTMYAAIDWSYHRLSRPEQRLFTILALFPGGATKDAITFCAQIAPEMTRSVLAALIEKNLAQWQETRHGVRYTLLVLLRAFGEEQLRTTKTWDAARRRLAEYYLQTIEHAEPQLNHVMPDILEQWAPEQENVRAVLRWTLENDEIAMGLRLAGVFWPFWVARDLHVEGVEWLEGLLQKAPSPTTSESQAIHARALNGLVVLCYRLNHFRRAAQAGEASLALWRAAGDQGQIAIALNDLANVLINVAEFARAETLYREALAFYRERGEHQNLIKPLLNLGKLKRDMGNYSEAEALYRESFALGKEFGIDDETRAILLNNLGEVFIWTDQLERAIPPLAESLRLFEGLNEQWGIAMCQYDLGRVYLRQEKIDQAFAAFQQSMVLRRTIGDREGLIQPLIYLSYTAIAQGTPSQAQRFLEEALDILQEEKEALEREREDFLLGCAALACALHQPERAAYLHGGANAQQTLERPREPAIQAIRQRDLVKLRATLSEDTFTAALQVGRTLPPNELLEIARSVVQTSEKSE